jgi:hypothetical protein
MMWKILAQAWPLLVVLCLGRVVRAEGAAAEYIEYRYQPELGRISISDCFVRGDKSVAHLQKHARDLPAKGIYPCLDDKDAHVYRRSEMAGGRKIDTLLILFPPTGGDEGEEGAYGTQRLIVRVNGRRKIDCTIGTSHDGGVWVSQVNVFPEDGTIEVRAVTGEGEEIVLPEEWESLDDPTVITDDSFFEDDTIDDVDRPVTV